MLVSAAFPYVPPFAFALAFALPPTLLRSLVVGARHWTLEFLDHILPSYIPLERRAAAGEPPCNITGARQVGHATRDSHSHSFSLRAAQHDKVQGVLQSAVLMS